MPSKEFLTEELVGSAEIFSYRSLDPYQVVAIQALGDNWERFSQPERYKRLKPVLNSPEYLAIFQLHYKLANPDEPPNLENCQWDDEFKKTFLNQFWLQAEADWMEEGWRQQDRIDKFKRNTQAYHRESALISRDSALEQVKSARERIMDRFDYLSEGEVYSLLIEMVRERVNA